jgi:HEXXH motif-containing protein
MTLRPHRLALTRFDALASGAGDLAGELSAAQLSKRLVQIVTIRGEIAARFAGNVVAGSFAQGYELVAAARQRSRTAVDAVLGYPQVGAWTARTLRILSGSGAAEGEDLLDDLGHFGAIAIAAALAAGEAFDLTLRVRSDGTVMLPTLGLIRLGTGPGWRRARAGPHAATLTIGPGPGPGPDAVAAAAVAVPVRSTSGSALWRPLRRLASNLDGCGLEVVVDDLDPYRDCHRLGASPRLSAAQLIRWQESLEVSWATLVRHHRQWARSLSTGLVSVVPLRPRMAAAGFSASSGDTCGSIALTEPAGGAALAACLVHEYQHSKLSALLDMVALHHGGAEDLCYAPWRPDPRPVGGLLHGAYAHLGLVDFWQVQRMVEVGAPGRLAHFEFARWLHAVRRALQTLGGSGRLTPAGRRFVAGMQRRVVELRRQPVPVPREPRLLARDALLDHWTTWRLHNLRPDPDQVAAWAQAWLSCAGCPPGRPAGTVVPGRRWSGAGLRLELAYRRLRDPAPAAAPRPDRNARPPLADRADAAYLRDDHRAAARLYREVLARSPDRLDAWAGLALAHRRLRTPGARFLVAYPECVSALHRRILTVTGSVPDPEAIAAWLGTCCQAAGPA